MANDDEVPEELRTFLEFVGKDTSSNDIQTEDLYVKQIQKSIRSIKESREMEHRFQGAWATSQLKEGRLEERREAVLDLLGEMGNVSQTIYERIMSEEKLDILRQMFKLAAKSDSLEQFEENISNL